MSQHSLVIQSMNKVVKLGRRYTMKSDLPAHREIKEVVVNEIFAPTMARPQGYLKCNLSNEIGQLPSWQEFTPAVIGAQFIPGIVFACNTCDNIVPINDTLCQVCKDEEFRRKQEIAAKLAREREQVTPKEPEIVDSQTLGAVDVGNLESTLGTQMKPDPNAGF